MHWHHSNVECRTDNTKTEQHLHKLTVECSQNAWDRRNMNAELLTWNRNVLLITMCKWMHEWFMWWCFVVSRTWWTTGTVAIVTDLFHNIPMENGERKRDIFPKKRNDFLCNLSRIKWKCKEFRTKYLAFNDFNVKVFFLCGNIPAMFKKLWWYVRRERNENECSVSLCNKVQTSVIMWEMYDWIMIFC